MIMKHLYHPQVGDRWTRVDFKFMLGGLGEPQLFCQTWDFVKLAKTKFAFVNGQKLDEKHNT